MNSYTKNYLVWLVIIFLCILSGMLYFSKEDSSSQPPAAETQNELPEKEKKVKEIMDSLTLDEKIGQLILAKVPEGDTVQPIQEFSPGGYLIFSKDVEAETEESLTAKIAGWQENSRIPMIIASDEEGGDVTRVSEIIPSPFLSPGELYAQGGLELLKEEELQKASILKSLGINVNLAPVADISLDPNSFIYSRTLELPPDLSLSEASEITSAFIINTVNDFKSVDVGCCLKHFPGYGENADSHEAVIVDNTDKATIEQYYFYPFKQGIDAGAGSVLISHNISNALDPNVPASLSPTVHEILRNNLQFNGVILCDDLDMAGLYDFTDTGTAAIQTLNAGTDMIICSTFDSIIPGIKQAVENGSVTQERIDTALKRVLSWKYDLGLLN